MARQTAAVATALAAILALAGVAASAQGDPGKMTICHKPDDPAARKTMQIARSAWSGHRGHGDHEGPCRAGSAQAPPGQGAPPARPMTHVALLHEADGDVDGDAWFRVAAANQGSATAIGQSVTGTLRGDGEWSVHPGPGVECAIQQARLRCDLPDTAPGRDAAFRLAFDGHVTACRQAAIDLTLSAGNDASGGDDRVKATVAVGACSALGGDPLA